MGWNDETFAFVFTEINKSTYMYFIKILHMHFGQ